MKKEKVEEELIQNDNTPVAEPVEVLEEKRVNWFDRFFHITERGSSVGKEIIAGIIVFLSMIYILPVNTSILGDAAGAGLQMGIFAGTAITSFICTMIMGLVAGYPVMLSAGMGLNATIAYTVCLGMGYSYSSAMTLVFVSGVIFMILSITPVRSWIINSIPNSIKKIISAGLGFFICLVGLKGSGIIQGSGATLVTLGNLRDPGVVLAIAGVILVFVLTAISNKYIKRFAILISMGVIAIVGLIMNYSGVTSSVGLPSIDTSRGWLAFDGIKDVFGICFSKQGFVDVFRNANSYAIIFVLIFVNLFDTTATLVSVGHDAGFLDEEGQLKGGKAAMLADAAGAVISAPFGVSPVTSFAESSVGIEVGGRTGLSAVVTALLFALSLFIYPIFSIFSSYSITALALVSVGSSIVAGNLKEIDWSDKIIGVTGFITIIMIVLTYSLSDGIGFGIIIYTLMMICSGKAKEVKIPLYVVAALFVVNFVLKAIFGI